MKTLNGVVEPEAAAGVRAAEEFEANKMLLGLARRVVDRLAPAHLVGHDMRTRVLIASGSIEGMLDAAEDDTDLITDELLHGWIESERGAA